MIKSNLKHFKKLEEDLSNSGWESIWRIFNEGGIDVKHHLLLDNIYKDNCELGSILDNCCKYLICEIWSLRTQLLSSNNDDV